MMIIDDDRGSYEFTIKEIRGYYVRLKCKEHGGIEKYFDIKTTAARQLAAALITIADESERNKQ